MHKILVYTPKITNRVQYLFDFVLTEFSGLDFELTTNVQFYENSSAYRINFSNQKLGDEVFIPADDFLFETELNETVDFDALNPFGKIFYALSRYEEYLNPPKDHHHRFSGKGKVYETPFVDELILDFQQELRRKYPSLVFKKRKFEQVLTCDVDQAWKYKHKGWKRTFGATVRDAVQLNFAEIKKRNSVIQGHEKDPFDTYDYFKKMLDNGKVDRVIFFWLLADYAKFDKNNPVSDPNLHRLIKEIATWAEMGIHPSYASNSKPAQVGVETARLAQILGKSIGSSRQHYLKLEFPTTYRNLISHGLTDDYTMAYADEVGFRAGTCTSFHWFDLNKNQKTGLKIHPLCAMDVAMRNYLKWSPEKALRELNRLKSSVEKVNGTFSLLIHNSNLTEEWSDWKWLWDKFFTN